MKSANARTLAALRVVDADAWEEKIRSAMSFSEGRVPDAAYVLGVGARTLYRWLQDERFQNVDRVPLGMRRV